MANITLRVNGAVRNVTAEPDAPLLYVLRNDLELNGPKFGCGLAQCGSCTVIMDGNAIRSCVTPLSSAQNKSVTTLEGLGSTKKMHRIQQAFVDEQAVQCGYCTPGFIMSAAMLMEEKSDPTRSEIEQAITGNLCRCTGYYKILQAIEDAGSKYR